MPVILGLGLLPVTALAADEVSYLAYSWDGSKLTSEMKSVTDYTLVASTDTAWGAAGETTWYVADGDVSISNQVDVNGSVNLLLKDDCELSPNFIIISAGSTLTIYAQTEGETAGKLVCSNGIGTVGSTLIIHGGTVNATGTIGAGIGGRSRCETGGTVTIYVPTAPASAAALLLLVFMLDNNIMWAAAAAPSPSTVAPSMPPVPAGGSEPDRTVDRGISQTK